MPTVFDPAGTGVGAAETFIAPDAPFPPLIVATRIPSPNRQRRERQFRPFWKSKPLLVPHLSAPVLLRLSLFATTRWRECEMVRQSDLAAGPGPPPFHFHPSVS